MHVGYRDFSEAFVRLPCPRTQMVVLCRIAMLFMFAYSCPIVRGEVALLCHRLLLSDAGVFMHDLE